MCIDAGCSYIWLLNEGGGWGIAEYIAQPFGEYGYIIGGRAWNGRYTKANGRSAGWSESVIDNDFPGWYGYRWIYPIKGVSGGSWVAVNMNGYAYLSSGYTAGIGPVLTWNYVTWLSMPIRRSERWMKVIKGKLVAFLAEIVNLISGAPW